LSSVAASPEPAPMTRILCVDDDEIIQDVILTLLSDDYEMLAVDSGSECLRVVGEFRPDIILMDVQMPGPDGYETCTRLKAAEETREIPVIFVSALSSAEERLAGYNAGGDDYITKPFDDNELRHKVRRTLDNVRRMESLKQGRRQALTANTELALISRFMHKTLSCHTADELAVRVLDVLGGFGLDGSVQFCIDRQPRYWSTHGNIGPLEQAALDYILEHGKLNAADFRYMASAGNVAVLISNMPVEDAARHARLESNLKLMSESADARLSFLATERQLDVQGEVLREVERKMRVALAGIDESYSAHREQGRDILSALAQQIEASFYVLAISDEQETQLKQIVEQAEQQIAELFAQGLRHDSEFGEIMVEIRRMLNG